MENVAQVINNCTLTYDLTEHSLSVHDDNGQLKLKLWRLRDNPGGFDIALYGYRIEVNNPTWSMFIPVESTDE